MKIRGGALNYTLAVSMLMASVISSIMLLGYHDRIHFINDKTKIDLLYSKKILLESILNGPIRNREFIELESGCMNCKSYIKSTYWGGFEMAQIKIVSGNKSITSNSLIGNLETNSKTEALQLYTGTSLKLAGSTKIVGSASLLVPNIETKNIEGISFTGIVPSYVTKIEGSPNNLIEFTHIEYLYQELSAAKSRHSFNSFSFSSLEESNFFQSFDSATAVVPFSTALLKFDTVKGNVVIRSPYPIKLPKTTMFLDVLIVAPSITIEKGVEGRVHLIASDSVIIKEEVELSYPSSISLLGDGKSLCRIGEDAILYASLFHTNQNEQNGFTDIESGVQIVGDVLLDGVVQLKGHVEGTLTAKNTFLKTSSGTYENYLLDAVINPTLRSPYYVAGYVKKQNQEKGVALWLD